MKLKLALLILAGITSSVISNPIQGQDPAWPRFRGPNGSGIALEESRPPVEFGEEENLRWKVEFAEGTSSPVIWKDHIYLTCCVEEKGEMQLVCLNRHNGEHLWTRSYFPEKIALEGKCDGEVSPDEGLWMKLDDIPEVPTPVAVNGLIFTVKDGGVVSCMDASTGKVYYSEKLGTSGGYFASPVATGGYIYIAGHRGIVHVIRASEEPEVAYSVRLDGKILATPAIAGNTIYFRTSESLYAFGDRSSRYSIRRRRF